VAALGPSPDAQLEVPAGAGIDRESGAAAADLQEAQDCE
jgi:hypothetical protein